MPGTPNSIPPDTLLHNATHDASGAGPQSVAPSGSNQKKQGIASFLALFTSTGTLLCCALPATIAAVAGGAAMASFVSTFPWLIPLSRNKEWIFLGSGLMILFSAVLVFRPKGSVACSITGGQGCEIAGRFTKIMLAVSIAIYLIGMFSAYLLVPILRFIDG